MGVSADRPYLDIVYKLVSVDGRDVRKRSAGKATVAGAKQVFRQLDAQGMMCEDIIGGREETLGGTPLLVPVMAGGRPTRPGERLEAVRGRAAVGLSTLPAAYRELHQPQRFPVSFSARLTARQP
jgi:nicotinate phosphoribosyltransferase